MRRDVYLAVGSAILIVLGLLALYATTVKIPDITSLRERKVVQSTKIYDRTGIILLDDLGDDITRTVVTSADIADTVKKATVAIEDKEFYQHHGIKISSLIRSVLVNVINLGYAQGGSTITQQVVKNSILTSDKTITRKVKEWILALKLEQALSKDQILELYLNEAPYGGSVYGVEEASQRFFGKNAKELSVEEAAYLAAIPQAPTYYSPYGNHRDALETRKNLVLSLMHEQSLITDQEYERAKDRVVDFLPQAKAGIRAPHFVFYVREQLEREYGREALEKNSWRVVTTLDADLEEKGEEIVKRYALENSEKFNASNASIVAIAPQTGDILAMVGSRDYFDPAIDGNVNIAVAERQPGSSFKPFVYAAAFMKGYAPETVAFDMPTQFSTECPAESTNDGPPCYYPGNYDEKFRGPMSFRSALAQSINIVALKVLYLVGIQDALNVARSLGITTLKGPDQYGLTLVLGGGEVKLLEMTSAYGVFANEGVKNPPRAILKIENRDGTLVKEYPLTPETTMDYNIALNISDILSDNAARAPEFGLDSALYIPGAHVAAKTGTTNDYRDAWIMGYTPTLAVGAWAGNNDNTPMFKKIAGFIVAPMWNEFVRAALKSYPDQPFPEPRALVNELSKPMLRGVWQIPEVHDILYWVDRKDPLGPTPTNPGNDPQFARWEYGARRWAAQNGFH